MKNPKPILSIPKKAAALIFSAAIALAAVFSTGCATDTNSADTPQSKIEVTSGSENSKPGNDDNSDTENSQSGNDDNSSMENSQSGNDDNSGTENSQSGNEITSIADNSQPDSNTTSSEISKPDSETISSETEPENTADKLTVHFLDVGQGDSIFIELPGGECMLIDAAEKEQASKIIRYIHNCGYDSIDYLVATHPHSDHIGGMADVINAIPVKTAYLSPASHTTKAYEDMLTALISCNADASTVKAGDILVNGEAVAKVAAPVNDSYDDLNNASVVVHLSYGEKVFLFTGDAEKAEEDSIRSNIKCDVLKIGHHGSSSSTTKNFLKKTEPTYAVISCAAGNSYGHPHTETMARLKAARVKLYRTDLQGDIVFTCDKKDISVNVAACDDYSSGGNVTGNDEIDSEAIITEPEITEPPVIAPPVTEPEITEPPVTDLEITEPPASTVEYVLNTNTKKIHFSYCASAKKIKPENRSTTTDYAGAIAAGYVPCKNCNP